MPRARSPGGQPINTRRHRKPLALVAEDSPETRTILHRLCERRGFQVMDACDGAEAVHLARRYAPDLVFLDLIMPRLDGLQALERIRDHAPGVPVVIVSARSDSEVTEQALELGAVNLIRKPFDQGELIFVLDQIYRAIQEESDIHEVLDVVEHRSTSLVFTNATGILSKVVGYLGRELVHGYPGYEIPITEIKLALYEALANALEHGNLEISYEEKTRALEESDGITLLVQQRMRDPRLASRTIQVQVDYGRHCAIYRVRDEGPGFDHASYLTRPVASTSALHGRGITLIRHYVDEVSWNATGNEIVLRVCLRPRGYADDDEDESGAQEE